MAATLVLHGAIDEQMFADSNGEHIMVYARLRPFLTECVRYSTTRATSRSWSRSS